MVGQWAKLRPRLFEHDATMKNLRKRCLLILAVVFAFGCSRQMPQSLTDSLVQLQQQKRIAIGYIYDRKLSVVEPGSSVQVRDYTIPGPGFYAANLGPSGSFYGVSRQDENEFVALRPNGEISWRRRVIVRFVVIDSRPTPTRSFPQG